MNNPIMQLFGNVQNFQNQFNQLQQQINQQGLDPQMMVQQLLNSGKMSQAQFNQLRDMANAITGRRM